MYYILYNPLSSNGQSLKNVKKIKKAVKDKTATFEVLNIIEVSKDIDNFVASLNEEDKIVVVGGDGTLHYFANAIKDISKNNEIFLFKGGTGNDFSRDFKKKKLINISSYIRNLPSCVVDEKEEFTFVNSCGFGFDGEVCRKVNEANGEKGGLAYIKTVLSLLKNSPRYELEVEVDGVKKTYSKVLFSIVTNGKYFGGGMKLSPKSSRDDDILEFYVINKMGFGKILCVFPFIFLGKHMWFRKWGVDTLKGKSFVLRSNIEQTFESDGEVITGVKEFRIKR